MLYWKNLYKRKLSYNNSQRLLSPFFFSNGQSNLYIRSVCFECKAWGDIDFMQILLQFSWNVQFPMRWRNFRLLVKNEPRLDLWKIYGVISILVNKKLYNGIDLLSISATSSVRSSFSLFIFVSTSAECFISPSKLLEDLRNEIKQEFEWWNMEEIKILLKHHLLSRYVQLST